VAGVREVVPFGLPQRRGSQVGSHRIALRQPRRAPRRREAPLNVLSAIGLDALLRNKRASARPQDLADVDALERLIKAKKR
jgi:hypothetical protein